MSRRRNFTPAHDWNQHRVACVYDHGLAGAAVRGVEGDAGHVARAHAAAQQDSDDAAPPEPRLLQSALRLTVRGWETRLLSAPDGSGGFGITLDLRQHEAIVEHVDGRERVMPLTPNRAVRDVMHDVLAAVQELARNREISPTPRRRRGRRRSTKTPNMRPTTLGRSSGTFALRARLPKCSPRCGRPGADARHR